MTSSILLINVYFGQFPLWFPAFLLSCRYNPDVEWLIVSDNETPPNCPENVRFLNADLDFFNQLASEKLGVNVRISPSFPFKIVDLKPAFGKIFEDYLKDYTFWGQCDIDLVWGNIRTFIDQHLLENFDIITSRKRKISGHFCLYRNVPDINLIFKKIPNFFSIIQQAQKKNYYNLDERPFTAYLHHLIHPGWFTRMKNMILGIQHPHIRVYWDKMLTISAKHQKMVAESREQSLKWINGRTFNLQGEEMMYLHFHLLKHSLQEINFGYEDNPTEFMITKTRVVKG